MKIVFWSNTAGKGHTTASMLAIACMTAWNRRQNSAVLPLQGHNGVLFRSFISKRDEEVAKSLADSGMDSLVRTLKEGAVDSSMIVNSAFSFCKGRLNVYTPTKNKNVQAYEAGLKQSLASMFTALDSSFDVAFLDCPAGMQVISGIAIDSADAVVVCLPQSYQEIDDLFNSFNFSAGKYFFLFGDYDTKSMCNLKNLQRSYNKLVTAKNSAAVPHCTEFGNSMNSSTVVKYFARNVKCGKNDPNYQFIKEVDAASEKLMRFCGARIPGGGDADGQ